VPDFAGCVAGVSRYNSSRVRHVELLELVSAFRLVELLVFWGVVLRIFEGVLAHVADLDLSQI